VYDFPEEHPILGLLAPSADALARSLAGRDRARLQLPGACAANILGLSGQVPAKAVFLIDGPSRTVQVGPTTIPLRRTTPPNMEAAGRLSRLLIAQPGTSRLVPPPGRLPALRRDCQALRDMYLSEPPTFENVLATPADLEGRLNQTGGG
jgi:hypothetical protein